VAVVVVRLGLKVDEVDELHDTVSAQIVVSAGDARIDDGDADSSAVKAKILGHPACPRRRAGALERAVEPPIRADRGHCRRLR
jgi:hypothetical protein